MHNSRSTLPWIPPRRPATRLHHAIREARPSGSNFATAMRHSQRGQGTSSFPERSAITASASLPSSTRVADMIRRTRCKQEMFQICRKFRQQSNPKIRKIAATWIYD